MGKDSEITVLGPEDQLPVELEELSVQAGVRAEQLPAIVRNAGARGAKRFLEFFAVTIENENTRAAYVRNVARFLRWLESRGVTEFRAIQPLMVAAYRDSELAEYSAPTVKQHISALRRLFDWLVEGQVMPFNPAASVKPPKHKVTIGKTPVLDADQTRELLDSIPTTRKDGSPNLVGLRDRAILAAMVFSCARVGAIISMTVSDYFQEGKRWKFRLHEKGGVEHVVPVHHKAEESVDAYLDAAGIRDENNSPLFRSSRGRSGKLTDRALHRTDALRMVKRRVRAAGLPASTCNHTFRATGITVFIENGGSEEEAQKIAAHADKRTTALYNRTERAVRVEEIERIRI